MTHLQFVLLLIVVLLTSCGRIKNKAKKTASEITVQTRQELEEKTQDLIDAVIPPFDADEPNTENNKERFKEFIEIELTPDISNIYCFNDPIGADVDYMFSFNCNSESSAKIISRHLLSPDTINTDNGFALQHDFEWWHKDSIEQLQKYSWSNNTNYHKYYWYSETDSTAYYFEFSL